GVAARAGARSRRDVRAAQGRLVAGVALAAARGAVRHGELRGPARQLDAELDAVVGGIEVDAGDLPHECGVVLEAQPERQDEFAGLDRVARSEEHTSELQ